MLKIAWSEIYAHPLPEGHRFPMDKYDLIPKQLLYEGIIEKDNLFEPKPLEEDIILQTHDADYWQRMKALQLTAKEMRKIGFPLSQELVLRETIICQGTIDCTQYAQQHGVAMNVAGGTHHAYTNKGEGFCLLNDFAIAANWLLNNNKAKKILIIDLDVHQGNGTAQIFRKSEQVFCFSLHGQENYPLHKEKSHLDIGLPTYTTDEVYLNTLSTTLPDVIDKVQPDFAFYLSGVDILESDKLGKLSISKEGCRQRDIFVFETLRKKNISVVVSMGGGYSPKIADIVNAHCTTFKEAQRIFF
jgi:acetoin utilization deacetylase AcuC-like enzyme